MLILSNLMNYIDRGIIPGAANEIQEFIQEALGEDTSSEAVNGWFGALVSAYIASYSIAAVVFGQLARSESRPLRLVGAGLIVWCFAAIACFFAQPKGDNKATMFHFVLLLGGRVLSGCGEAGFQCIVPGLINNNAPADRKALWMAGLYTPIPVGTAMGYMIGGVGATTSLGWSGAYGIQALLMLPIACLFCVTDVPSSEPLADDREPLKMQQLEAVEATDSSLAGGVCAVLSSLDFCLITLGYAAHTAVFAGLAAFGPTIVLGLGFFRGQEAIASTMFGAAVALGGAIGTPLGGWLSDRGKVVGDDSRDPVDERQQCLKSMICMISIASVLAMCCVASPSEKVFLPLICVVVMFAYGAQASITMATLSCVSKDLQALAMSLTTLGIHAFGDVPSPIIIGMIKGSLAPHCAAKKINGKLLLDPACEEDRPGLRYTLAIVNAYLFTAILWWVASLLNTRRAKKIVDCEDKYNPIQ